MRDNPIEIEVSSLEGRECAEVRGFVVVEIEREERTIIHHVRFLSICEKPIDYSVGQERKPRISGSEIAVKLARMLDGQVAIGRLAFDKNFNLAPDADPLIDLLALLRANIACEFRHDLIRVEDVVAERSKKRQYKRGLGRLLSGELITVLAQRGLQFCDAGFNFHYFPLFERKANSSASFVN